MEKLFRSTKSFLGQCLSLFVISSLLLLNYSLLSLFNHYLAVLVTLHTLYLVFPTISSLEMKAVGFGEVQSWAYCHAINERLSCRQSWIWFQTFALYSPLPCWFDPAGRGASCLDALKAIPNRGCLGNRSLQWLVVMPTWGHLTKCTCPEIIFHHLSPVFWQTLKFGKSLDQIWKKSLPEIRV